MKNNQSSDQLNELFTLFASIKSPDEIARFMKDLCTPQEIKALADRWQICKLLHQGELSYRDINQLTGVSLATITRVARFLKNEPYHGYILALNKIKRNKKINK
ncbi:TrpR like protein, YerC/YecD [Candidatus Dependentiae bacterium]|nr:TrpR like protein, YerC/YecD [Candidatus Dependentiae bacterium]